MIIIPFPDLPVFKLRYSLAHGIVLCLSSFIFYFRSALIKKVSNFLAVIAPAFVLINSFTGLSRMSHIWTVIKPTSATKSSTWSEILVLVHAISFVSRIGKVLTPRSVCPIILVSPVVPCILCALALISK